LDRPNVHLALESTPETLALVRGAISAVAEWLKLDQEVLDDLKTAVSEACNNVVMHAYGGRPGPLEIAVYALPDELKATVRDRGSGIREAVTADDELQGVGMPIIRALTHHAEFLALPEGGTEVSMSFRAVRDGRRVYSPPGMEPAPEDGWLSKLGGDAVASLSPLALVGGVLGRLARALAARARFSLDRFSDVYLLADAIAVHAARAAATPRLNFALSIDTRRLELMIGPLRRGASSSLQRHTAIRDAAAALALLSDEVTLVEAGDDAELLQIVMTDGR
jgi:serine/threonine-protein kinase RsbW